MEMKEDVNVIYRSVQENMDYIEAKLGKPNDLILRTIRYGGPGEKVGLVCIEGLSDSKLLNDKVIKPLQLEASQTRRETFADSAEPMLDYLEQSLLSVTEIKRSGDMNEVIIAVLSGETAIFEEGTSSALIIGSRGWTSRSIEEPISESLVRGARDGFIEDLRTNITHLRRRIRDPKLRLDAYTIGTRSKKDMTLVYVEGIIHPDLLKEVKRRLATIDIDEAEESGTIEQWIEDSFLSPFPQFMNTERPDRVAAAILQGKFAIFLDGTPFVLIAPLTFGASMQSPDDYYERFAIGTFIRILRYGAAFFAVFLPALYIALLEYHHGMIPSNLAFSIASTREGMPFPVIVEAILMELTMELLREAGLRLPKPLGQTVGIVGGIIIGEAAVSAGIVSPIMVIIVAITAVSSFAIPSFSMSISFRILRFAVMGAAAVFGFFGIVLVYIMINIHIVRLKSFGIPYSTMFAPMFNKDMKDTVLRAPLTMMKKRPKYLQTIDKQKMSKGRKP